MAELRAPKPWHFDILVSDGFVLSEMAAVTDILRISNRTLARPMFSWSYRSIGGGIRRNPSDIAVETKDISPSPTADFLFVLGNADAERDNLVPSHAIRSYVSRGAKVYLLAEAAAQFIARDTSMAQRATHWENASLFWEKYGTFESENALAVDDGAIVTCAGMGATVDVMLVLIGDLLGKDVQINVANIMLHESVRGYGTLQPGQEAVSRVTGDREVDRSIALMHQHIDEPLSISEINDNIGTSPRALERKFQAHVGTSPSAFYRKIRLHRANNLLVNTTMSVTDIGVACGFGSGFSNRYKQVFGVSPNQVRKRLRIDTCKNTSILTETKDFTAHSSAKSG
ncbi:GlxA family transcriptional regulator [Cognatishimia sp.]|uniref:GlxA family transcriptional regulator n=1 Tax=Cognatishimia sp. TaxID=2211648 RepID=UPI003515DDF0